MAKQLKVNVKRFDSNTSYLLDYDDTNGLLTELRGKFTRWDRNGNATELTITKNEYPNSYIFCIDFIQTRHCNGTKECNELQIKTRYGTPNIGSFPVQNCDLKNTEIIIADFCDCEIKEGVHNQLVCADCFKVSNECFEECYGKVTSDNTNQSGDSNATLTPKTKKGNIIVGNP